MYANLANLLAKPSVVGAINSAQSAELIMSAVREVSKQLNTGSRSFTKCQEEECSSDADDKHNIALSIQITSEMLPIKEISVSCEGADQGWGNSNQSVIRFAVSRGITVDSVGRPILDDTRALAWKDWPVNHDFTEIVFHMDQSNALGNMKIEDIQEGDEIIVWCLSAPYAGFQCHCKNSKIVIQGGSPDSSGQNENRETSNNPSTDEIKDKKRNNPLEPTALNDSALGGIDRLGYSAYAESIVEVLRKLVLRCVLACMLNGALEKAFCYSF
jgi:hypothetical protein